MKRITILGATGSIGQNTLSLIRSRPNSYKVSALTGGRNVHQLAANAIEFDAELAVTAHDECYKDLKAALADSNVQVAAGQQALEEAALRPADWTMSAIMGLAGLAPGFAALSQGQTVALANKETLVAAGPMVMQTATDHGARLLPVDSEHSGIFQALSGAPMTSVKDVTITASGGAFRDWPIEKLSKATPEQAATHPNWSMGQRITMDSASMFNKAMEVLETKEFFGMPVNKINVLIHPQSLVHAIVQYVDGACLAHIGPPDMRHAIVYALDWPERKELALNPLDLAACGQLDFSHPDPARYPALGLVSAVNDMGGMAGTVFTAAKERALDHFITGALGFMQMTPLVKNVLNVVAAKPDLIHQEMTLESIADLDQLSRKYTDEQLIKIKEA